MKIRSILFITLLSLFLSSVRADYPGHDLENPRQAMTYFLKSMVDYKNGNEKAVEAALKAIDLSSLEQVSRLESGKLVAKRLIKTLDRLERINIASIPDSKDSKTWVYKQEQVNYSDQNYSVVIAIEKSQDGKFRFNKATVETIRFYEAATRHLSLASGVTELHTWQETIKEKMPNWTESRSFWLLNGQWLALFFLILVGFIFDKLIAAYSGRLAYRFLQKKGVSLPEKTKANFTRPIGYMALSGFWILTLGYIELSDGSLAVLLRAGKILFTFSSVAACLYFVDIVTLLSKDFAAKSENKFDDILVPLVSKTSKFLVFAIGLIFIGTSFTLDMKNLLAGLGIGGIAFALAAKDTISNLFGSLTVLLDRPFRIGDWVVIDGSVEGTIEEVGLRSTRVRTSYDSLITVPNGTLTNASIDNYGQRKFRRFNTTLGVQYDTPPEKIEAFCEGIRYIITTHKNTRKDYFHVYFTGMGDSALQVMLYVFFKVPDRSSELNARHHLLIDVLRLANEMQVEFAFPTQTLHLFNQATSEQKSLAKDYLDEARALGKNIAAKPISSDDHKSSIDNL